PPLPPLPAAIVAVASAPLPPTPPSPKSPALPPFPPAPPLMPATPAPPSPPRPNNIPPRPPFCPSVASQPLPINRPAFGCAAVPSLMNTPINEVIGFVPAAAAANLGAAGDDPSDANRQRTSPQLLSTDASCTAGAGASAVAAIHRLAPATANPA